MRRSSLYYNGKVFSITVKKYAEGSEVTIRYCAIKKEQEDLFVSDGGQEEACSEAGLIHVCLRHLQDSTANEVQTEPLFLQWLCLCLGKIWEDFTKGQLLGLQADAPVIFAYLLSESQPEVRASAVFALGTLLDIGFDSSRDISSVDEVDADDVGDEDDENGEEVDADGEEAAT